MVTEIKTPTGWKKIKVNKAFEFIPTTSHSKGEMTHEEEDASCIYNIHYGDIHAKYKTYVDFEKNKIPHLKDTKNGFDRNLLISGDLVMVDASEDLEGVGTCIEIKNLHNKKCVAGLHTFALRDSKKHTVPGYRGLMLKHKAVKHRMQQVSTYSKVFGMSKKSFSDIDLILPPLPEQEKIVEILETSDSYIEELTKTIRLKKKFKKGLVRKLLTGKLRLPGFNGEWQNHEIGELLDYEQPSKYIVSDTNYSDFNKTPVLTAGKSFILGYTDETEGLCTDVPVIIFDDFTTANKYVDFEFKVKSSAMKMLRSKDVRKFNLKFIYERMQLISFAAGEHKRKYLSEYQYVSIKIPDIKEQTAIAQILTTADQEIEALEKKKELVENQKKFLLNNLITGKIRLPEFVK